MTVEVSLKKDRKAEGTLRVESDGKVLKEFRCLGLSDQTAATAHKNISRDPLKPFGDIPTGTYTASRVEFPKVQTEGELRSYGPGARFLLTPTGGEAAQAASVRQGLMVHGGPTGFPMPQGRLRPTHGCLRVDDETLDYISNLITKLAEGTHFTVTVEEVA